MRHALFLFMNVNVCMVVNGFLNEVNTDRKYRMVVTVATCTDKPSLAVISPKSWFTANNSVMVSTLNVSCVELFWLLHTFILCRSCDLHKNMAIYLNIERGICVREILILNFWVFHIVTFNSFRVGTDGNISSVIIGEAVRFMSVSLKV